MWWEKRENVELSKKTQKLIAAICGVVLFAIIAVLVVRHFAPAFSLNLQSHSKPSDTKTAPSTDDAPATNPDTKAAKKAETPAASTQQYAYTAAAGDSYTLFARDAVQQYAKAHSLALTYDQALQAEATLATNAGSPLLEIGQGVTIEQRDVAAVLGTVNHTHTAKDTSSASPTASKRDNGNTYSYTTIAGDSYTALARTAIASYASAQKLGLTGAQRIAAEANLVTAAGSPELAIGQVVTFSTVSLKNATDIAKSLSPSELAAWQPYATLAGL